ncbi:MAG: cadherin domain-containing protein, partial [Planctomycetaceae bacterium]
MSARTSQHQEKLLTRLLTATSARVGRALSRSVGIEPAKRSLVLDELEQRVLYSATPVPVPADVDTVACVACEVPEQIDTANEAMAATQLVVVDADVADYETLVNELAGESGGNFEVVMLDGELDGIEQLTDLLNERTNVEALHIVSHGEEGKVRLGSSVLSNENLAAYSGMFAEWDNALTADADILFYGCDLGGSAEGQELIQSLSILTGADIAASDDQTGHVGLGGDWELEVGVGEIQTEIAFSEIAQASWYGVLATAPSLNISSGATTTVDTSVAMADTSANFTISADGSVSEMEATLSVDHGSLTLSDTDDVTLVSGEWFAGSTMTVRGSVVAISNAMQDLVYTPDTDWSGTAVVSASIDDLIGGAASDSLAITVVRPFVSAGTTTHADSGLGELNRGLRRGVTRSISTDADGRSVAAWTSGSQSYWEVFDSDGSSLATGTFAGTDPRHVSVAMDPSSTSGSFVATWTVGGAGTETIEIQRFDLTGATSGAMFRPTLAGVVETNPSIAMNAAGDYGVVWESGTGNLRFERFGSNDLSIDGGSVVVPESAGGENPAIGIDGDRNILISWDDGSGQYVSRYDGTFNKTTLSTETFASGSSIGMNDAGEAVIAWHYSSGNWNIDGQRMAADGSLVGSEFFVPAVPSGDELNPSVSIDQAGNFAIAWEGDNQIQMRQFAPNGTGGSDIRVDSNSVYDANASVSAIDAENVVVLYTRDGGNPDILSRRFTSTVSDFEDPEVFFSQPTVTALSGTTVSLDALLTDADTQADSLSLAFSSSRPDIVDATLITESGGDALRTLSMPVAAGVSGTATITVTVSDGNGGSSTSTFDVVAVAGIQVTTTADEADGDRSSIAALLANPGGTGISLREAIEAVNANANAGVDSITFDLAGSGAHVITVVSGLPDIETPIDLDATGQAGRVILDGGGIAASGLTLGEDADGSTISGLVIRDFGLAGITIKAGSDGSVVQGNRIGSFDDSGAAAAGLGNGEGGIEVLGSNNLIGGAGVADGNVLSGNGIYGVQLQGTADLNQIVGNFIGTNETGSVAAGNTDGIRLIGNASNTTIDGNVISGNADYGITLFDDVNGTQIVSNQIGTGSDQTSDLGNGVGGVRLIDDAANNMVGGSTATANTIAFNSGAGISAATNTAQNTFRFNKIYSNSGLGIDLEDDDVVETNDGTDSDPGANGLQNYPELYAAEITGGDLSISGQIDSTPNSTFDIDFYVSSSADATGHGEGERHIGTVNVTTDSGGNASITQTFSGVTMSAGEAVSGTATDAVGNTSEFGQNVIAVVNPAPVNATPGRARVEFNGSVEFSRATGNQIRIMDADAGVGVLKVELTATHGTFSLGSTSSVAFGSGDGTDDSYIEVFGTLDQLNQAFDGLVFTPTADYSGRASLVLNTDDQGNSGLGGAQVDVDEIRIEVGAELQTRAEFTINQSTTGNQRTSSEEGGSNNAVAILADGSYVVVWTDDTTDGNGTDGVYGRILAPDGTVRVDEFRVATSVAGEQRWASVAADAQGRFVVTWTAADADADGVYMRRFNLDGTPIDTGDVAVNTTTTGVQWNATVAINASGNGMIVWEGNGPGDSDGVFGRLLSVSSGLSGAELRINVDQTGNNHNPAVTVNDGGDFVVVWERDTDEIVSRSLPGGALTQPELVIATGSNFTDPVVAMSHDGDFVVAYYIDKTIDQVEYVAVSAAGSVGTAVTLPTSALTQRPGLATDGYGEYVLAYRDQVFADVDIEIIRFAAEGDVLASAEAITINSGSGTNRPSVDMSDSDNFIVVWDQTGVDSDGSAIVGQAYGSLVESRLVTSTTDDGSASGVNFTDGAILSFGGDALSLELPTTAGDLSVIVEAGDLFAPDADIDALHVVGRDMLVGTGDSSAQLRKGDILFTLDRTATSGPLELTDNDVAVARPIEGTTTLLVFILFDDIDDPIVSGMRLRAFTLVEQDTLVGDTVVQAGNLLFTPSNGGGRNKNIYVWETEDVFEGTTTGSATLLIDGAEFGIDEQILGMELFEESIEIGGRVVGRGSIALTTNNSVSLFSAEPNDVFAIVPTTTNLGSGVAAGTGYLLFDGSDVGFSNGQTELDALAITGTHINHAPVLTSRGPSLGITNEDTTSSPIDVATILDTSATDSDYDFVGMAITSATGLGTWEYSLDGVSWTAFGSISDNSSLLLDGAGQIRYIPNGLNGEAPRIVYRAWDQTVGLSGERIDTTVRGGNTAFSDDTDTAILTVTDVNDAPTVSLSGVVSSLAENTSTTATTKLADIVIADDGTGTNTPSLSGVDSASFTLIGSELHLRSGITLDFEDQTTYSVTITIDDGTFSDSVDYTLSVTDVNEAPTLDFTQTLFSIDEDRSTASVIAIGDIVLSDDALGTNNLSLIGTDAGSFNIVGNSVVLRAGVVLDYESQTAFNVSVVVDDPDIGTTSEVVIPITLTVNDVNDVRPVIQVGQSFSIPENLVVGDGVGTVVATDVDTVGTLWNWTIESGDTGGVFQINSGTGEITIADASNLDFENTQSYTLQISVSDGGQTSVFEDVDITVTDVNDVLPVIPGGQSFSIGEDAVANAVVGTVLASDADTVGTLVSWAIHRGNDDGIFQIATGTGEITIADPTNLDFESADTYTLEVSVSDGVQSSIRRDITITINDVDDESPVVSTARFVVSESDVAGFSVGTVTATDVDSSPPFTNWQVVSGDVDGLFSINSATGVIQLVASPDYELRQSYVLTVSTSDGVNTSAPANIAIDIQDENDNAPIIPAGQTLTIAENATAGTVLGTVAATDVDSVGTLQNWQILSGDPDGIFAIDPANGTISVVSPALLDFETQPNFTLQVGVSDGIQQSTEDVTISVQDDTAEGTIAGTIWDDLAGDGAAGQNNAVAGVRVDLYRDNGDDWIGSDDTFVGSVTTTASGYSFIGLEAGRYYVVVDSTTVSSTEDATPSGDLWAEQTWGSAGSLVRNTFTASDGGLYGGRRGQRSDDASSLLTAEHVTMVDVTNATADASFGFSFNVVTNVLGGDDRDDDLTSDRTIQGSLRQFILNANAIVGSNAMRFVPRVGATSTDADANKWWTLNVTEALPTLTDDGTSIDGTAWNALNSVRDTNSVLLGRDQAVGLGADGMASTADDVSITQLDGVEFEIVNDRSATPVAIGLDVAGDDIAIRRVAVSGFGDTADMGSGNIRVTGQDVLIVDNVLGSLAGSFDRPDDAFLTAS